jgi:hypothetical protein
MNFVLVVFLVQMSLWVPVVTFKDEAPCKQIVDQITKSADKFNSEIKLGCMNWDTLKKMEQMGKTQPDAPQPKPLPEAPLKGM